jgi:hypothetical protein
MSEDKVHDLFPASCRLAIGSTDVKGTNTIEQWKATLEKTLKERYRLEWQKAINEDDVTGMIELIIKYHTTSGKASSYADKRRAEEKYRNHLYIEGTTIAAYSHQLY